MKSNIISKLEKEGRQYFKKKEEEVSNSYLSASGGHSNFMGVGSGGFPVFKIIWYGLGALMIIYVVGKGVKLYKEIKR